jgi:hypothetical protein
VTDTELALRLNSSTKSWVNCPPELPPPPYSWLMTMSGEPVASSWGGCSGDSGVPYAQLASTASRANRVGRGGDGMRRRAAQG